jgi:hypothetical protein
MRCARLTYSSMHSDFSFVRVINFSSRVALLAVRLFSYSLTAFNSDQGMANKHIYAYKHILRIIPKIYA